MNGNRIKQLRKHIGLTQIELGKKLGVVKQTVSSWENNISEPKNDMLIELAKILNTTPEYLLGSKGLNQTSDYNEKIMLANSDEERLLRAFRSLGEDSRIIALSRLLEMERAEKINDESEIRSTGTDNLRNKIL